MIASVRRRRGRERGQSLVEFALFLPILIVLMLGIGELARVFSTMIAVESGAREAADFGALAPGNWEATPVVQYPVTIAEMERRACTPTRSMTEYAGAADGTTCTNPAFECELYLPGSGLWTDCSVVASAAVCSSLGGSDDTPCKVRVRMTYVYEMVVPTQLLGLPNTLTFTQESVFNIAVCRSCEETG